jgi:hypothetical protein
VDYSRIYSEFVADRKAKPEPDGYSERHHILPRSLGGDDSLGNLIDLTADDHFFAHLLLAKIHGGKMGSALYLLTQVCERQWKHRFRARRSYALARKIALPGLVEGWTGANNPLFNETAFEWENYRTGDTRTATMFAMHLEFGASRPSWTSVANGSRPSIKGWLLRSRKRLHKRSEKGQRFTFVNRDGRSFTGTQADFVRVMGLGIASASRMVRHESVTLCGWRLAGTNDRPANYRKDGTHPRSRAALSAT